MTSHKEPAQTDGLHLAVSPDGLKWQTVNDDKSVLKPTIPEVFRDPSIAKDETGAYHLIWTIAWGCGQHKGIGYSSSRDLIKWSEQRVLPVMRNEPKTEFIWAPEPAYPDDKLGRRISRCPILPKSVIYRPDQPSMKFERYTQ